MEKQTTRPDRNMAEFYANNFDKRGSTRAYGRLVQDKRPVVDYEIDAEVSLYVSEHREREDD